MAWWRLEWIKLKRERTQKLFWQNKKMTVSEKRINKNELCCIPPWQQNAIAFPAKPPPTCNIAEHFSESGMSTSRHYLGVMKIAAHDLQRRNTCEQSTCTSDVVTGATTITSLTGRFTAALWGTTKVHVKSFDTIGAILNGSRPPICTSDHNFSQTAHREMSVLLELRHPGLLLLMGVSYTSTTGLQLIFENITIGSLYNVLHVQRTSLTVDDICRIVLQVCDALRFMHQHSWLHLGLSSHAVLLTMPGQYKLSAFELAKKQTKHVACRMNIDDARYQEGIIKWQAPEQCLGDTVGPETDIYTLSVLLQEMISGRVPWEQSKAKHVRRCYAADEPLRNHGWLVSSETHTLLQRGLAVQRSQRTLSLDELEDLCNKHMGINTTMERRIFAVNGNSKMKKTNKASTFLSFKSFKRHLSSCQTCAFDTASPDPLRKIEVYAKTMVGTNCEDILQIPEEIYFDDYFDTSTKLGTHLQLMLS